jgi:hypothetical protein
MAIPTTRANQILDMILKNESITPPAVLYLSLHTGIPGETGANEASGGSYARKSISWNAANSKQSTGPVTQIQFDGMPACTVTHFALWSHATETGSAYYWWGGELSAPKTLDAGDICIINEGELTAEIDPV